MTEPARFHTIRTDRLLMRRWLESDRAPFAVLNADPETMRFFPQMLDRAASDALVDRIEMGFDQQGYGLWALEVVQTGEFIGFTGLNPMPDGVPGAGGVEVGWRLARHAWHHGYATEAARAALTVAFDGIGLNEIWSMTAVLNEPSQAVMRRLGLTEVARFNHPSVPAGHPVRDLPPVAVTGAVTATARPCPHSSHRGNHRPKAPRPSRLPPTTSRAAEESARPVRKASRQIDETPGIRPARHGLLRQEA